MLLKGPDPREVLEKIEQERLEEEILRVCGLCSWTDMLYMNRSSMYNVAVVDFPSQNEGRCARFWRGFKTACRESGDCFS